MNCINAQSIQEVGNDFLAMSVDHKERVELVVQALTLYSHI